MVVVHVEWSNKRMARRFLVIEIFVEWQMSTEIAPCSHQIDTNDLENTVHHLAVFSNQNRIVKLWFQNISRRFYKGILTFQIPRMCIFAIISAVNNSVMNVSQENVTYWRMGTFSNVFGVLSDTEANDSKAHIRINRRTHN